MTAAYRRASELLRPEGAARRGDDHRALEIRPADLRAQRLEGCQRVGVGVPMPVVGADADQRHLGSHRREERRIGRARTVVGHGQHIGRQLLWPVGQQVGLGLELDVARQQHSGSAVDHAQHQGGLVELTAGEAVRTPGRGMQHLDRQVTEVDGLPLDGGADGHAVSRRRGEQCCERFGDVGLLGGQRRQPHGTDPHPPQHLRSTTEVIEMWVGDHDEVDMTAAMPTQPPRRGPVLTGVHQNAGSRRLHEERITLTHVDRRHP
jgi:hypothetical protein